MQQTPRKELKIRNPRKIDPNTQQKDKIIPPTKTKIHQKIHNINHTMHNMDTKNENHNLDNNST